MTSPLKIFLCVLMLATTIACAFVQNRIFPPATEPQGSRGAHVARPRDSFIAPIICNDDNCLQACLDRLDEVLQTRPFASIGNSIYEEQGAEFNLVVYKVDGDEIADPAVLYVPAEYQKYQEDTAAHRRIWDFYVALIPPERRQFVNEFVIYTDGTGGDTSAWVNPSPTDEGFWQVGIDLLDSDYPPYLAETLLHETAHVLTLNTSQVPYEADQYSYYDERQGDFMKCEQYVVDGGCSLPDSYINRFYQRFWKDSYAEWWKIQQEAQQTDTFDEYLEALEPFYDRNEDWFLNSYAATGVEEDMAESFSFFALNQKPSGNTIYEQKVAFYYEFPELVEYRRQMIEGLCAYIQR